MFKLNLFRNGQTTKIYGFIPYSGDINTFIKINNKPDKLPILIVEDNWGILHGKPISLNENVVAMCNFICKKNNRVYVEAEIMSTINGRRLELIDGKFEIYGYIEYMNENEINNIHIKIKNKGVKKMILSIICKLFNKHHCTTIGYINDKAFGYCRWCNSRCYKNEKGKWVVDTGKDRV